MTIQAYAAHNADGNLELFEYELGSLKPDEVEIDVEYCGICHSDLHMLKNEWGFTRYPLYNEEKLETIEEMSSVQEAARKMKEEEFIGSS